MELRALLLLLLCFPGLQAQTPQEESRSEGSTLYIQCPYTPETDYYGQKVWYHVRDGLYKVFVESNPHKTHTTKGKVTIQDNYTHRTVYITMTDLQAEDSGTYSCAYRSGDWYITLRTISLNVFKELHKWELDSLSVQCPYSPGTNVWCRRSETLCNIVARTDTTSTSHNSKALEGRTSIQRDTQQRTVTVTVQKLQAQDAGVYWCALYSGYRPTRIMEVRLSVSKRTQQYTAKESGNVSVQCPYSTLDYGAVSKAWCKEGSRKACTMLANTMWKPSGNRRKNEQSRVTIQDDTQQGIVTITMEKLQAEDSGVYWCALYEHTHLFRIVEVTLNVSEASAETAVSGTPGTSPATPSGNTPASSSNVKTFILLLGVLSVLFILALISLIILCVRRHKQLKRRGTREAEDIYEKPEDIAQLDSAERMESPKDDSEDLKYVTLNFKSQLSLEDPLYCNVEPSQTHRKPEDESVEYAIIALKQLPANDKG
ncbi:PREDICTED: uncharacterized protein LOC104469887 [Pterocles gutturalis]|uniref:uncharacterized protein LOC104469887 n=1 Tax=Pterocles gutturalis TaxID=240206 RepID=UPI0005290B3D|nr:PREDICTED: uncharacterized protein LOC104469887 [Pterocles gutturalis]